MLKLLIADDEFFIRERLKVMLDYNGLGFEMVAAAADGNEAYSLIKELQPDIAILDIKMPMMSGLEVARLVHENALKTKIIILTSYEVFEFAHQSIQYGASGYLLKPVDKAELENILVAVRNAIESENNYMAKAAAYDISKKEEELLKYLTENISASGLKNEVEAMLQDSVVKENNFFVLFKTQNDSSTGIESQELKLLVQKDSFFSSHIVFSYTDNIFGILINIKPYPGIHGKIIDVQQRFIKQTGFIVNIAVGAVFHDLAGMIDEFDNTLSALESSMFREKNAVLTAADIKVSGNYPKINITGLRDRLLLKLRSADLDSTLDIVRLKFDELKLNCPAVENLKLLISEILLTGYIYVNEVSTANEYSPLFYVNELIESYNNADEIYSWVENYFSSIYPQKNDQGQSQISFLVKRIQQIIDDNYSNPYLGLDFISSKVCCSQNYISTIFKKTTGFSIVQYITKCRMEAAQHKLKERNVRLNEIYSQVGYSDVFYFSKRFKKFCGVSPSDYANMHRNKN